MHTPQDPPPPPTAGMTDDETHRTGCRQWGASTGNLPVFLLVVLSWGALWHELECRFRETEQEGNSWSDYQIAC